MTGRGERAPGHADLFFPGKGPDTYPPSPTAGLSLRGGVAAPAPAAPPGTPEPPRS